MKTVNRIVCSARWLAGRLKRLILRQKDYVTYKGSTLPPRNQRFNGPDHGDDAFHLASAISEASRVMDKLGYVSDDLLVDLGCGQGRLAIGLARRLPAAHYIGLDVSKRSVEWCSKHLTRRYPSFEFQYIDVVNARYNPGGQALSPTFRLPVADGAAAIVYACGVVTNMEPDHLAIYAREMSRMLRPTGVVYLTANVEDNVPLVTINPDNYVSFEYHGPLNIVRYKKQHFLDYFSSAGLVLEEFEYHANPNCQSNLYFRKA